jgi:hypothetical protein
MSNSLPPIKKPGSKVNVLVMIWTALFFFSYVYLLVAFFIYQKFELEHRLFDSSNPLGASLLAISGVLSVLIFIIPSFLLKAQKDELVKTQKAPVPQDLIGFFFFPFIVRVVLCDSIAILGFVSVSKSHDYYQMIPHLLLSTYCFLMAFPSDRKIRDALGVLN